MNTNIIENTATEELEQFLTQFTAKNCPVRNVIDRIGDKWSLLVILTLGQSPKRFRVLLRAIDGISQRMLTVTLRGLERDGLVARQVFDTRPPQVEYSLTDLGASWLGNVASMTRWAASHDSVIKKSRKAFDKREV